MLPRLPVGLRRAVTDLGCLPCTPRATLRSRFRSPAVNGSLPAEGFAFSGESRVKMAPSIVPLCLSGVPACGKAAARLAEMTRVVHPLHPGAGSRSGGRLQW